jgi:uncharacterized membrane protein
MGGIIMQGYAARLGRDLDRWEREGIIDRDQRGRIEAESGRGSGSDRLQAVLVLCACVLAGSALVAFVAANWSGMSPVARMGTLLLGNVVLVALAFVASVRAEAREGTAPRAIADGLATLSLAFAACSIALVAQTFHAPPDQRGFARTVAVLGLLTALVTRSRGATVVSSAALLAGDLSGYTLLSPSSITADDLWFWTVGPALLLLCLSGRVPAGAGTFLALLLAFAIHIGVMPSSLPFAGRSPGIGLDVVLAIAAAALVGGHAIASRALERYPSLAAGGGALSIAAGGLALVGTLSVAGVLTAPDLSRIASRMAVWGGVLPTLAILVAAQVSERRVLFWSALVGAVGLMAWILSLSPNLIGFSGNLLVLSLICAGSVAVSRRLDRRPGRTS